MVEGRIMEADTSTMAIREGLSRQRIQQVQEVATSLVYLGRERLAWLKHEGETENSI